MFAGKVYIYVCYLLQQTKEAKQMQVFCASSRDLPQKVCHVTGWVVAIITKTNWNKKRFCTRLHALIIFCPGLKRLVSLCINGRLKMIFRLFYCPSKTGSIKQCSYKLMPMFFLSSLCLPVTNSKKETHIHLCARVIGLANNTLEKEACSISHRGKVILC